MTKNDFVQKVLITIKQQKSWRAGQTMFNVLSEMKPEVANKIRATNNDPFYNNDLIPAFLGTVDELWEDDSGTMLSLWWENLNRRR